MKRPALLSALGATVLLVGWAALIAPPARPPAPPPAVAFWEWSGRPLDPAMMDGLAGLGCRDLFVWCGSLEGPGDTVVAREVGTVPDLPPGIGLHLVLRCEASVASRLGNESAALAATMAGLLKRRAAGHAVAGVQIDCDVPQRRLKAYAATLRALRAELPADWRLGATMLLSWRRSPDLAALAAAVDELVPQFYNTTPATPTGALVQGGDLASTVAALERLGVAYRIGLPTYEQMALFRGGRLAAASIPLGLPALLGGDLPVTGVHEPGGWGALARCTRPVSLGMVDLRPGDALHGAMPSASGLAARIADLRRLDAPHCRGLALFRLPAAGTTRTLSLVQVGAALAGTVRPGHLVVTTGSDAEGWRVSVSNPGDDDWLALARPVFLRLDGCGAQVAAEGGPAPEPTRGGQPCTVAHADGVRLRLRCVPAGGTLALRGVGAMPRIALDR